MNLEGDSCNLAYLVFTNMVNLSLVLFFPDTPSFGISRVPGFGFPITEGISVSLKCDVDSNPASNPIWQKGKNNLFDRLVSESISSPLELVISRWNGNSQFNISAPCGPSYGWGSEIVMNENIFTRVNY